MLITTVDFDEPKRCGIDVPLRRLMQSPFESKSAYWQKLLELVEHLQSQPDHHELFGYIISRELNLEKSDPPDADRIRKVQAFIDEWKSSNPDPQTWGTQLLAKLRERFPPKPKLSLSVTIDRPDHAPLTAEFPDTHYRFRIRRPGQILTEDLRAKTLEEASRTVYLLFDLEKP